jgi:hypothetical protein
VSLYLDSKVYNHLRKLAAKDGRSVSSFVRHKVLGLGGYTPNRAKI